MTHSLLYSPWNSVFEELVRNARSSLVLCSPYIGRGPTQRIIDLVSKKRNASSFRIRVLTDLSRDNIISGSTDVAALLSLAASVMDVEIRFLPSLHAKVYVIDETHAVVTSANLTDNGLSRNIEYGVMFSESGVVRRISSDALQFAALGSPVDRAQLELFCAIADELRGVARDAERKLNREIKRRFDERIARADLEILRARSAGRTAHAIFAETILYLLTSHPLATIEMHQQVRAIHPDLCDDSIDRVIDGRHFGKRWKHDVRSAQVYLRRQGRIRLAEGCWRLVDTGK